MAYGALTPGHFANRIRCPAPWLLLIMAGSGCPDGCLGRLATHRHAGDALKAAVRIRLAACADCWVAVGCTAPAARCWRRPHSRWPSSPPWGRCVPAGLPVAEPMPRAAADCVGGRAFCAHLAGPAVLRGRGLPATRRFGMTACCGPLNIAGQAIIIGATHRGPPS